MLNEGNRRQEIFLMITKHDWNKGTSTIITQQDSKFKTTSFKDQRLNLNDHPLGGDC
jgi:hypothetical protein